MRSHGSLAASWLPYCIGSATLCFCFFTLLEFIFLQVIALNLLRWRYEKENDCFVQCDNCSVSDYIFLYLVSIFCCRTCFGSMVFQRTGLSVW